jgi:UDP:flavonoid glycosyltransferase YjiC (YdhE family)
MEKSASLPNPMTEWGRPLLDFSQQIVTDFKPDLIVSSLFGIGLAELISEASGIPWCFVNPSFYFGDNGVRGWSEDWYGPYIPVLARDCFLPITRHADLVLHATDSEFDFQPSEMLNNEHYVGFLLWEPKLEMPTRFKKEGNPWALITLSSVAQDDEVMLAKGALAALADQPVRSLLTQPDHDFRKQLGTLPNNAQIAGFVPHSPILKGSAIVINHAGHGIVSKAISFGVPMVLVPWDRDQPGVAARAEILGVAKVVPREQATAENIQKAVKEVFKNESYGQAAKKHSERIQAFDALGRACAIVEEF